VTGHRSGQPPSLPSAIAQRPTAIISSVIYTYLRSAKSSTYMLIPSTVTFLKDLKNNNHKTWFDENRARYETARKNFESFVDEILQELSAVEKDISDLKAKDCMFRINRDVRFSKNKLPYKTNMAAYFSRGGKKSLFAGYYFHLEPGASFAGGGLWAPLPAEVKKVRQEIDYCQDEFNRIISSKKFKGVFGDLDKSEANSLVNIPRGYEKDHPAGDYIKLKSWIVTRPVTDAELTGKNLAGLVTDTFKTLQPFIKFINRSIE
jgi:uncharacterized protein (TIGR02453 family)